MQLKLMTYPQQEQNGGLCTLILFVVAVEVCFALNPSNKALPSQLEMQSIVALIIGLCECCSDKNEAVTHSTGGRKRDTESKA